MMNPLTAVVSALASIDKRPVWRVAFERALRTVLGCGVVLVNLVATGGANSAPPLAFAVVTPIAGTVVSFLSFVLLDEHPRKRSSPNFWPALRVLVYIALPSATFSLVVLPAPVGSLQYAVIITVTAGAIALLAEFATVALRQGGSVLARNSLSEKAEQAVLAAERGQPKSAEVSAVDLDAQLAYRYQRAREEAEAEVRRYLPTNPRTAKRMVNHVSLAMAIAEQRGLFRDPIITQQHLGKWIGFSEQWPALGAALTAEPERMKELEQAPGSRLQEILDKLAPGIKVSEEMERRLRDGVQLGDVLDRLVRFEPDSGRQVVANNGLVAAGAHADGGDARAG